MINCNKSDCIHNENKKHCLLDETVIVDLKCVDYKSEFTRDKHGYIYDIKEMQSFSKKLKKNIEETRDKIIEEYKIFK
jgi:hypothetical protein